MARFTIMGGRGFIGTHLSKYLSQNGHEVIVATGGVENLPDHCGHLIYAIGVTSDFRERLEDAIEAHVGLLTRALKCADFDSFLYLSSTRVYQHCDPEATVHETDQIPVFVGKDSIYDLSKLLGESVCLANGSPNVRIARLANVIGKGMSETTFLGSILSSIEREGSVSILEEGDSSKDYIAIGDVVEALFRIAVSGQESIYTVASGKQVSHRDLIGTLQTLRPFTCEFTGKYPKRTFPSVSIARIQSEFGIQPADLRAALHAAIN